MFKNNLVCHILVIVKCLAIKTKKKIRRCNINFIQFQISCMITRLVKWLQITPFICFDNLQSVKPKHQPKNLENQNIGMSFQKPPFETNKTSKPLFTLNMGTSLLFYLPKDEPNRNQYMTLLISHGGIVTDKYDQGDKIKVLSSRFFPNGYKINWLQDLINDGFLVDWDRYKWVQNYDESVYEETENATVFDGSASRVEPGYNNEFTLSPPNQPRNSLKKIIAPSRGHTRFNSEKDEFIIQKVRKHPRYRNSHKFFEELASYDILKGHTGNSVRSRYRNHLQSKVKYVWDTDEDGEIRVDDNGRKIKVLLSEYQGSLKNNFTAEDDYLLCSEVAKISGLPYETESKASFDVEDFYNDKIKKANNNSDSNYSDLNPVTYSFFDKMYRKNPNHTLHSWRDRFRKYVCIDVIPDYLKYYQRCLKLKIHPKNLPRKIEYTKNVNSSAMHELVESSSSSREVNSSALDEEIGETANSNIDAALNIQPPKLLDLDVDGSDEISEGEGYDEEITSSIDPETYQPEAATQTVPETENFNTTQVQSIQDDEINKLFSEAENRVHQNEKQLEVESRKRQNENEVEADNRKRQSKLDSVDPEYEMSEEGEAESQFQSQDFSTARQTLPEIEENTLLEIEENTLPEIEEDTFSKRNSSPIPIQSSFDIEYETTQSFDKTTDDVKEEDEEEFTYALHYVDSNVDLTDLCDLNRLKLGNLESQEDKFIRKIRRKVNYSESEGGMISGLRKLGLKDSLISHAAFSTNLDRKYMSEYLEFAIKQCIKFAKGQLDGSLAEGLEVRGEPGIWNRHYDTLLNDGDREGALLDVHSKDLIKKRKTFFIEYAAYIDAFDSLDSQFM